MATRHGKWHHVQRTEAKQPVVTNIGGRRVPLPPVGALLLLMAFPASTAAPDPRQPSPERPRGAHFQEIRASGAHIDEFRRASAIAHPSSPQSGGDWVGTITTEGTVTTVVNQSGSVWGGSARLVEEASIGRESGDDPYLLGTVGAVAAHDGRIFVLDRQIPTIRVYDLAGMYLYDIGRGGSGPGELGSRGERSASAIAVDGNGRLYVKVVSRIDVFSTDGDHIDSWAIDGRRGGAGDFGIAVTPAGAVVLAEGIRCPESRPWSCGVRLLEMRGDGTVRETGLVPDLGYEVPRLLISWIDERGPFRSGGAPPFVPELVWIVGPAGDLVVGRADRYEFERYNGAQRTVISRSWEPVPVQDQEHDWYLERRRPRSDRPELRLESVTGYDLDDGLPRQKPAFERFIPTHEGGMWVLRPGPGVRLEGCDPSTTDKREMLEHPCWRDTAILDAFDADGRYLGDVEVPEAFRRARSLSRAFVPQPFIGGGMVIAVVEDELGTIMVKRYRVVPPAEAATRSTPPSERRQTTTGDHYRRERS